MVNIQIFDVSGFVHTAMNTPGLMEKEYRGLPVGGIHFFLRRIISELVRGANVVCCFDGKASSKSRMPGYKGNRKVNPAVVLQCDLLYDLLRECNIYSYRGHGEADEYVYNICEQYKGNDIYINGCDYDLCHNIINSNTHYHTCNSRTNNVEMIGFSNNIGSVSETVTFNTLLAYKVFCGDKSDNIPGFKSSSLNKSGKQLYREYRDLIASLGIDGETSRKRELLEAFINATIHDSTELELLTLRMNAIYPRNLIEYYPNGFEISNIKVVNLETLADHCKCLGDYDSLRILYKYDVKPHEENYLVELKNKYYEKGKEFAKGHFVADNNLNVAKSLSFSTPVNVKGFK